MEKELEFDDPKTVQESIMNPSGSPKNFILTLSDFKTLYKHIFTVFPNTKVDIVLNRKWSLAQFSELCNHRIRIFPDNQRRPIMKFFHINMHLDKKDFEFIYHTGYFYGQEEYLSFGSFILEEIKSNGIKSLFIFILSSALLYVLNTIDGIKSANELIIAIGSIFFSIFLLFTVNQNLPLMNMNMFKKGLTHRFINVDIKISYQVIFVIGLSFFNLIMASIPPCNKWMMHILIFSTSLSIALMGTSLISVIKYYFSRIDLLHETKMSRDLLDQVFDNTNKE